MKHKYKKLNAKERKILKTFTKAEWKAVEIGYGLIGLDLPKVVKHWRKLGFTDNNIMDMLSSYKQIC